MTDYCTAEKTAEYLERPAEDELTKFSWGSSWKNKGLLPGKDKNQKNHKRNQDKGNTGILSEKITKIRKSHK